MAGRKVSNKAMSVASTSISEIASESGIGGSFTKREAVALRVLIAFIDGKGGMHADAVSDVLAIADKFSDAMGWD